MFYFARSELMEQWSPFLKLGQIFGRVLGEQNVTGVAAIHHPLCQIQTGTCQIGASSHIDNSTDRTAMDAHAQPQPRIIFDRAA